MASLQAVLQTFIQESSSFEEIKEAVEFNSTDLPNPEIVDEEFARWKKEWVKIPLQSRPHTLKGLTICA